MHKLVLSFYLIFVVFAEANTTNTIIINDRKDKKEKLLKQEKYVEALVYFTKELKNETKNKQNDAVAENICGIAECLFQLKNINELEEVITAGILFTKNKKLQEWQNKFTLIKAKYLIDIGKEKEAIQILNLLDKKDNSSNFLIDQQLVIADANYKIGNLEECKKIFNSITNNSTKNAQLAQAYNGIGSYYYVVSKFDSAKYYYEKSLLLYQNELGKRHTKVAQLKFNLGLIASKYGDIILAKKYCEQTLEIYQSIFGNHHPKTAEAYGTLGVYYMIEDNIGKSIYYLKTEENILIAIYGVKTPKLINNYLNATDIYTSTKDFRKAEEKINYAITLIEKYYGKRNNLYTQSIVKLAILLTRKNEFGKAEKLLNEVLRINLKSPNDYIPDVYLQLGINFLAQNKYEKAILNFEKANHLYIEFFGDKNAYSIDALTEISNTYLQQKQYSEALKYAVLAKQQTLDSDKIILPYDYWGTVLQELKCKKEMYKFGLISSQKCKSDIELIKQTIIEANKIRQTYYSNGSQLYYAEKIAELNEIGIYLLTHFYKNQDQYFYNNLLYFAENNKANLLRNKITREASNELLPEQEKNKAAIISERFNHFISLQENQEETNFNLSDSVLYYENLQETFAKHLEKKYPKIYALKYGQTALSISQIQEKLKDNNSFLLYFNDVENYYCLSISKNRVDYKLCGNKNNLDSLIEIYASKLISKNFDKNINQQLSLLLLPIYFNKNLIISTDAMLQNISFDALFLTPSLNYLIQTHAVQYAFSTNTYFNHQSQSSNKKTIAFFPNFEHTNFAKLNIDKELKSLKKFPYFTSYQNSTATKSTFLNSFYTGNILHIASHLVIDTLSPLESAIIFQPQKNYLLTINDIWKLKTNMQLVTLAACYSNFGKMQNGEGMQNFAWAFQYAGVHNILSTQWNASDKSTANIISEFYANLKSRKSKEESLRLAKINYLNNTDAIGAEPFFWASFNIFSDETAIKIPSKMKTKYVCLGFFILLLLLSLFFFMKRNKKLV